MLWPGSHGWQRWNASFPYSTPPPLPLPPHNLPIPDNSCFWFNAFLPAVRRTEEEGPPRPAATCRQRMAWAAASCLLGGRKTGGVFRSHVAPA